MKGMMALLLTLALAVTACAQATPAPTASPSAPAKATTVSNATAGAAGATVRPAGTTSASGTPTAGPVATTVATAAATGTARINPTSGTEGNISVIEPRAGETVFSPFRVSGYARVFEASLMYELVLPDGNIIASGPTMASVGAPEVGYYTELVDYPPLTASTDATLKVFSDSPRDGSRINEVEVPIKLGQRSPAPSASVAPSPSATATPEPSATDTRTITLEVYFLRPAANDVLQPFRVSRSVPYTSGVGRAALLQLLAGPTAEEQAQGIGSAVPPGVTLNSLRIEAGVAYADFSARLVQGIADHEQLVNINRQITHTLRQFSTIQSVVISVEGKHEVLPEN